MKWGEIFKDSFMGFIFIFLFSYFLHSRQNNVNNIMMFLWASPTAYFYLLYLIFFRTSSNNREVAVSGFINSVTLGMILGLIIMIFTIISLKNRVNEKFIFLFSLIITILATIAYINKKLYNRRIFL